MPTTVNDRPDSLILLPTICGSLPNRLCQSLALITIAGDRFPCAANPRPATIGSCSTSKKFGVTACPHTRSGSPPPLIDAGSNG